MTSVFETLREDVEACLAWYWDDSGCEAMRRAYGVEELLLKSDFGRLCPERAHELAMRGDNSGTLQAIFSAA
jgi:hypothetical protein